MSLISWLISPSKAGKQADNIKRKLKNQKNLKKPYWILDLMKRRMTTSLLKIARTFSVLQHLAKDQGALPNDPLQKLFISRNLERVAQTIQEALKQV